MGIEDIRRQYNYDWLKVDNRLTIGSDDGPWFLSQAIGFLILFSGGVK